MNNLHYLDPYPAGAPLVLLLHGLGANCSSWTLQFDTLQSLALRPVAVDIPGFGESVYDGKGWSFKRVAAQLAQFAKEMTTQPIYLVGLSMGGVIAQQLTLDHPGLVRKLVLVSTFSALRPASLSQWFYFAQRGIVVHTLGLKTQSRLVARRVFPEPGQQALREIAESQIASADLHAYRAAMRNLAFFNSQQRLKEIKIPTLVVSGNDDSTIAPSYQKHLADGIQGAKYVTIHKAGHAVSIDQYMEFNQVLGCFLAE